MGPGWEPGVVHSLNRLDLSFRDLRWQSHRSPRSFTKPLALHTSRYVALSMA
jgi:hypothetical protein